MGRLVARSCLGRVVNGHGGRDVREGVHVRRHPSSKAMERGKLKAPGHFERSDEIPSTLCACLSLNLHSWADGIVPL